MERKLIAFGKPRMTENDKALRHLASVRKIAALRPIPDADNIVAARVDGWDTVVKKGEYEVGDLAVYCEIDSLIPHRVAPFLTKKKEGITGNEVNRLKTLKLRGQISQGLLIKPEAISNGRVVLKSVDGVNGEFSLGDDVTEFLGITKYEAPIPGNLVSIMRGGFPGFIRKTDQERIQNFAEGLPKWKERRLLFEVTEKLDGSSMTVYVKDEEDGVCSRNINLLNTEEVTFWQVAKRDNLIAKLRTLGRNLALQGELVGPGIKGIVTNLHL